MRNRSKNESHRPETHVGDAIASYFGKTGIKRRIRQASVVPEWAELVGSKIAEVTTPLWVTADGILFVAVESAAWMQELQLMSPTILRELGKRGKGIKRIVWRAE